MNQPKWNHWTVRATTHHHPFKQFEPACRAWNFLKKLFPGALSAILMPNHLHLIVPQQAERDDLAKITGVLGAVSKDAGVSKLWQPIAPPALIPDLHHLRRQIRYVALNPCRAELCADPLAWVWSTYRDLARTTATPWVSPDTLRRILKEREKDFQVRFHAYVSGDPSVAIEGTAPARAAQPTAWAEHSIGEILKATSAALQTPASEVRQKGPLRTLFIHVAHRFGWKQIRPLAKICHTTPRAIHYTLENPPAPSALAAAALCLGDARLREKIPVELFPARLPKE
ncbi:hypothetical protein WDW37_19505 [Bdellovibrionota bacterium FG-1]